MTHMLPAETVAVVRTADNAVTAVAAVHDTIVRVAAPQRHDAPTWFLATITAVAAVIAGVLAQWFRVLLDDNRERERVRQVLMLEVATLQVYLDNLASLANAWQVPSGPYWWRQMDNAMRGYDELHTRLTLLPGIVRVQTSAWFLKVKSLRLGAESIAGDYAKEHELAAKHEVVYRKYDRLFSAIESDARSERRFADEVYKILFEANPTNWLRRIGAGIEHKHRTLEEARKEGQQLGLLPQNEPESAIAKPTPPHPPQQGTQSSTGVTE